MVDFNKFTVRISKEFKNDELVIEGRVSDGTYLLRSTDLAEEIKVLSSKSVKQIFEDVIKAGQEEKEFECDVFVVAMKWKK